jgi:hypothetical protein
VAPVAAHAPSHFYVYYRVAADTPDARAAIAALVADVEATTGISGRLLARCDDPSTWMEVYEPVPDASAFGRALAACVERSGAARVAADGVRRIEHFAALRPAPAAGREGSGHAPCA